MIILFIILYTNNNMSDSDFNSDDFTDEDDETLPEVPSYNIDDIENDTDDTDDTDDENDEDDDNESIYSETESIGGADDDYDPSEHDPEDINDDEVDHEDDEINNENVDEDDDDDDNDNDNEEYEEDEEIELDIEGEIDIEKCSSKKASKDATILQYNNDDNHLYGDIKWVLLEGNDRITEKYLYLYEMARVLGERTQQLIRNAPPLIELDETTENLEPPKIAYLELMHKKIPFIIRRYLPGKKYEHWSLDELEITHDITEEYFVDPNIKIST